MHRSDVNTHARRIVVFVSIVFVIVRAISGVEALRTKCKSTCKPRTHRSHNTSNIKSLYGHVFRSASHTRGARRARTTTDEGHEPTERSVTRRSCGRIDDPAPAPREHADAPPRGAQRAIPRVTSRAPRVMTDAAKTACSEAPNAIVSRAAARTRRLAVHRSLPSRGDLVAVCDDLEGDASTPRIVPRTTSGALTGRRGRPHAGLRRGHTCDTSIAISLGK